MTRASIDSTAEAYLELLAARGVEYLLANAGTDFAPLIEAHGLPVLFVVFNNRAWGAVKRAVTSHAREGWAVRAGAMPFVDLDPAPDYELICQASGGHGERVEDPAALPAALARALGVVRDEKRQALVNVICKKP
ncbi:MAG: hypothetical protein HYV93_03905 [Candidatus Rokubacteria bacterium]|nr:hypothetical protein [Candidatus Rokubacteria bacterium]